MAPLSVRLTYAYTVFASCALRLVSKAREWLWADKQIPEAEAEAGATNSVRSWIRNEDQSGGGVFLESDQARMIAELKCHYPYQLLSFTLCIYYKARALWRYCNIYMWHQGTEKSSSWSRSLNHHPDHCAFFQLILLYTPWLPDLNAITRHLHHTFFFLSYTLDPYLCPIQSSCRNDPYRERVFFPALTTTASTLFKFS